MKIKKKPIPLLAKKLKAEPKKRQKRGILRKTKTAKKQVVLKTVKAKKRVSFGKKAMYGKRQNISRLHIKKYLPKPEVKA